MTMTGMNTFAGVAPDHPAALLALPLFGAAIWACFRLVNRAAGSGNPLARRCREGYDRSTALTRRTAILLLLAGCIHLTLIPAHLAEAPATALLFALNALALSALAVAAFVWAGGEQRASSSPPPSWHTWSTWRRVRKTLI